MPLSIEEAREMVKDGDIILSDYRQHFVDNVGRPTTLTDGQILEIVRMQDDDCDPVEWARLMLEAEKG